MKKLLLLLASCASFATAHAQNDPSLTVGDTGTITFTYMGNEVTYTTVRGADGMIWLQQNLGSTQIATSSTDAASYGHYFQWGRWDDGHQVPTSSLLAATTIMPNDPSGIPNGNPNFLTGNNPADWWSGGGSIDTWAAGAPSSTNGTDPCAAVGGGWRMASQPEWANALTLENITDAASAFASNLKLPVGGQRDAISGTLLNVGSYAQYYTSTPNSFLAKAISIQPSAVNPNDDSYRSHGSLVRCVSLCTEVSAIGAFMGGNDTVCAGSTVTWYVTPVANVSNYQWTVPAGWTIVGADDDTTVTVIVGTTSGSVGLEVSNSCNNASASAMITVNPLPIATITATGNWLDAGSFVTYQWMVNDTIIAGATANPHPATESGPYQVIVTDANGCSDTSAVYAHTLGVNNIAGADKIRMYPNPAVNTLHIDAPMNVNVVIYTIDGRVALTKENATQVDISTLPAGTYHVKMANKDGMTVRMEKLTVLRQ